MQNEQFQYISDDENQKKTAEMLEEALRVQQSSVQSTEIFSEREIKNRFDFIKNTINEINELLAESINAQSGTQYALETLIAGDMNLRLQAISREIRKLNNELRTNANPIVHKKISELLAQENVIQSELQDFNKTSGDWVMSNLTKEQRDILEEKRVLLQKEFSILNGTLSEIEQLNQLHLN